MQYLLVLLLLAAQRPPDLPITPAERTQILERTAERIERHSVDQAKGKEIADALRAASKEPPIAEAKSALALVPLVNRLFRDRGGDRHLRFGYQHEPQSETDEDEGPDLAGAARNAFGIHGVQRLSGNVGLLTWMKFHEPVIAGGAVAAAMSLLQTTDALLIDVRNSDGGSPDMVALLVSYFVPQGEPVLLSTVENRYRGITRQYWTTPHLPAPRYAGKPVYILTSKRTFSAGEGFIEQLRRVRGNVTVVGETTRGGARMSRWMTVHPHFAVSVSVARHIGATKDWEGVGIAPDIAAPEADALKTAHLHALRALLDKATDADARSELQEALRSDSR